MRLATYLLLSLLQFVLVASASASEVDFETPSSLDSFAKRGSPLLSSGNGVGGSNALTPSESSSTLTFIRQEEPSRFSKVGDWVAVSIMFKYEGLDGLFGPNSLFKVVNVGVFGDAIANDFRVPKISAGFEIWEPENGPTQHRVTVNSSSGNSGAGRIWEVDTLSEGNWYKLSARFDFDGRSPPNDFVVQLDDFGPTGTEFVESLADEMHFGDFFSPLEDDTVWPGFQVGRPSGGGQIFVDNFRVVPEPHALVLTIMAAGFATVTGVCRRNR